MKRLLLSLVFIFGVMSAALATPTSTMTQTQTQTQTNTLVPTRTFTFTPSPTYTSTPANTVTNTRTATSTMTATNTMTCTATITQTAFVPGPASADLQQKQLSALNISAGLGTSPTPNYGPITLVSSSATPVTFLGPSTNNNGFSGHLNLSWFTITNAGSSAVSVNLFDGTNYILYQYPIQGNMMYGVAPRNGIPQTLPNKNWTLSNLSGAGATVIFNGEWQGLP